MVQSIVHSMNTMRHILIALPVNCVFLDFLGMHACRRCQVLLYFCSHYQQLQHRSSSTLLVRPFCGFFRLLASFRFSVKISIRIVLRPDGRLQLLKNIKHCLHFTHFAITLYLFICSYIVRSSCSRYYDPDTPVCLTPDNCILESNVFSS